MVAFTAKTRPRETPRSEQPEEWISGVPKKVYRWLCPKCDSATCSHDRWESDRRDPDYGCAMAYLECGHLAVGNRRRMEKTGQSTLRCIQCIPGHWIVHIREVEKIRLAERRAEEKERGLGLISFFLRAAQVLAKHG